jgi:hypothetical protein
MGALIRIGTILLVAILLPLFAIPSATPTTLQASPTNYIAQYNLLDQNLYVSIQPSLYIHYNNQSHSIPQDNSYAKFITPMSLQPIADTILEATQNLPHPEEQFANAVLTLVHQIPYNITGSQYPVETIVKNKGDCGALSLLAASIMKAGGLDVVLFIYRTQNFAHMNIGVCLPETPVYSTLFFFSTSIQYDNKTYWTAEATPKLDWKVGDQPSNVAYTPAEIVSVEDCEKLSPGQVSASLTNPTAVSVALDVSSKTSNDQTNRSIIISGSTEPKIPKNQITLYINKNGTYTNITKTFTDENGTYTYLWNITSDGTYYITASVSCNGSTGYAGADSEPIAVFIGPESLLQFQEDTYNYMLGLGIGEWDTRAYIGVKNYLDASAGTNSSFSYNFIVVQTGQSPSNIETKNIRVPASHYTIRFRNGTQQVIQVPAKIYVAPEAIPLGLQPLRLPDDFNATINDEFCFVIQKDSQGNFTLKAQGLDDYEIEYIKNQKENTAFLNASDLIEPSTWYRVTTVTSNNKITAELQRGDGASIESINLSSSNQSAQIVLLIANNLDSAIAVKGFQVNGNQSSIQNTPQIVHQPSPPPKSLLPFGIAVLIIAFTLIVTGSIINYRKRKNKPYQS